MLHTPSRGEYHEPKEHKEDCLFTRTEPSHTSQSFPRQQSRLYIPFNIYYHFSLDCSGPSVRMGGAGVNRCTGPRGSSSPTQWIGGAGGIVNRNVNSIVHNHSKQAARARDNSAGSVSVTVHLHAQVLPSKNWPIQSITRSIEQSLFVRDVVSAPRIQSAHRPRVLKRRLTIMHQRIHPIVESTTPPSSGFVVANSSSLPTLSTILPIVSQNPDDDMDIEYDDDRMLID